MHLVPVMGFLDVEIRRKVASIGGFLVDLDNLIKKVCLGAQIAGGGILASITGILFKWGAYRVMLIRGFSTLLLVHDIGFKTRVVSFGSLSTVWSAGL